MSQREGLVSGLRGRLFNAQLPRLRSDITRHAPQGPTHSISNCIPFILLSRLNMVSRLNLGKCRHSHQLCKTTAPRARFADGSTSGYAGQ